MSAESVVAAIRSSSLSEVAWVAAGGRPEVRGALTLIRGEAPVLAFSYAEEGVARDLARARTVALALTETRSTGRRFAPLLLRGRPRLTEDPAGEVFSEELLDQELLRFPPARAYADSALLRRENWWYLPRLLVEIGLDSAQPTTSRSSPDDHVLVVARGAEPDVHVATLTERSGSSLTLDLQCHDAPAGDAVLFGQDASFPDLEQWSQWRFRGRWEGGRFAVEEEPARTGLAKPLTLLGRWRREREFARRCRAAIP